jgi:hypothetical protein
MNMQDARMIGTPILAQPIGLARLAKMAFDGADLSLVWEELSVRALALPPDAGALMDLSTIAQLMGRRQDRLALQAHALTLQRVYRRPPDVPSDDGLRLLAFMAPGDFLANTPVEFLLERSSITLDMVYVIPGLPLPQLPEHDVALVAATELEDNRATLGEIAALVSSWPRPVLNAPTHIARLTRDGAWELLRAIPGVTFPINARIGRSGLLAMARGETSPQAVLDGPGYPIIARPVDAHAGEGLSRLESTSAVADYLSTRPEQNFFVAPFVDYRSADGLYRKYRVALIDGRPFACHMGVSSHWMIHYLNAGMNENAQKRAEEAEFFAEFDREFALRHRDALAAVAERVGLDYVTLDCGETPDGQLLIFEAGNGMIVHAMDPPELFPYKPPQMRKVFGALEAMLRRAAAPRPAACAA